MTVKPVLYGIGLALAAALGYWSFYAPSGAPPTWLAPTVDADSLVGNRVAHERAPDARPVTQTATGDGGRSTGADDGLSFISDLAGQDWSVEDFSARAKIDEAFALLLRKLVGLCTIISDENNPRFNDPRWRTYHERCGNLPWVQLKKAMFDDGWTIPSYLHPDIDAASKLPEGDPEIRRLAAGVLASSTDNIELQYAYALYFDPAMIRAMAGTGMHVGLGLDREDQIAFQIDASMYIACQFAESGCGWNDPAVLVECATTNTCFPGMGMYQILALRNSPLRMELFQRVSEDVARLRRGP